MHTHTHKLKEEKIAEIICSKLTCVQSRNDFGSLQIKPQTIRVFLLIFQFRIVLYRFHCIAFVCLFRQNFKSNFLVFSQTMLITLSPSATSAITLPVDGFTVGNVLPDTESTNLLLMKSYGQQATNEQDFRSKFMRWQIERIKDFKCLNGA